MTHEHTKDTALVVYTQDWHPEQTPHVQDQRGQWPRHCVQGARGAELHPDLVVVGPVVRKRTEGGDGYSGCSVRDPRTGGEHGTGPPSADRRPERESV